MRFKDILAMKDAARTNGHSSAPTAGTAVETDPSIAEPPGLPPRPVEKPARPRRPGQPDLPEEINLSDLRKIVFPPIQFVLEGVIPTGLTILSGGPKAGKSFFALQLAYAVATGQPAMGILKADSGSVLYYALEDNFRRLQVRTSFLYNDPHPLENRLTLRTFSKTASEGGLGNIRDWIDRNPDAKLVIVDTLQKFRDPSRGGQTYETDYGSVGELKKIADESDLAVIVLHHTRKSSAAHAFDETSGTRGLTGAADTMILMDRDGCGGTILVTGRDVAETTVSMTWEKTRWTIDSQQEGIVRPDKIDEPIPTKVREAMDWLKERLKDGPDWVGDMRPAAEKDGISHGTLYRAKEHLKIVEDKALKSKDGRGRELFRWTLPGELPNCPTSKELGNWAIPPKAPGDPENAGPENCPASLPFRTPNEHLLDDGIDPDEIPL